MRSSASHRSVACRYALCAVFACVTAFWFSLPQAGAGESAEQELREILNSKAETSADYAELCKLYLQAADKTESPLVSGFSISMAEDLAQAGQIPADPEILQLLQKLRDKLPPVSAYHADMTIERLTPRQMPLTDAEIASMLDRSGTLHRFQVVGPFGDFRLADFYRRFQPEKEDRPIYEGKLPAKKLGWRPISANPITRKVNPWEWLPGPDGIAYLKCRFRTGKSEDAYLHIISDCSLAIRLNRRETMLIDRIEKRQPSEQTVSLGNTLDGWNYLLIKAHRGNSSGDMIIRLLGKDLTPMQVQEWITSGQITDERDMVTPQSFPVPILANNFLDRLKNSTDKAIVHFALAKLYLFQKMPDEAFYHAGKAAKAEPENPWFRFFVGKCSQDTDIPENIRNHNSNEAYKRTLNADPDFVPALIGLGILASDNLDISGAREYFEKAAAKSVSGRTHLARLMADNEWPGGARLQFPEPPLSLKESAQYLDYCFRLATSENDRRTASANLRLMLESGGWRSHQALTLWLKAKSAAGDKEKGLAVTDLLSESNHPDALRIAINFYSATGQNRLAVKTTEKLLTAIPDCPLAWKRLGDLLCIGGDKEKALAAYRRSITLDPGQNELKQQVLAMDDNALPFWRKHEINPMQALAKSRSLSPSGRTARIIDQTVLNIHNDGSMDNYTHILQKILTRSGISSMSRKRERGQTLEIRTILPDGKTVDPIKLAGKGNFSMPGLKVGATVEHKFIEHEAPMNDGAPDYGEWYFRSTSNEEAFLFSQYIIRVHKSYPFAYAERNFDQDGFNIKFDKSIDGDYVVYKWLAENMPRTIREKGTPDIREYIPHVVIGKKREWTDINRLLMNEYLGRINPDRVIGETAAELAGEAKDEEAVDRLYRFVCEKIRNKDDYSSSASRMLIAGEGDRNLVLMALLKKLDYRVNLVAARPHKSLYYDPPWELPDNYFPIRVLRVVLDNGKTLWLDTAYSTMKINQIRQDTSGATGFVVGHNEGGFLTLPSVSPDEFVNIEKRNISIPPSGKRVTIAGEKVCGKFSHILAEKIGMMSARERHRYSEIRFSKLLPGSSVESVEFSGFDSIDIPLKEKYRLSNETIIDEFTNGEYALGLGLDSPALLPESNFAHEDRKTDYHLKKHIGEDDHFLFTLPDGVKILHQPKSIQLRNRFGSYRLEFEKLSERRLLVTRRFRFTPQRIKIGEEWQQFLDMTKTIAEAELQDIEWIKTDNGKTAETAPGE